MTKFRPCIDLHNGRVKQIVGGTLRDEAQEPAEAGGETSSGLVENFVAEQSAAWFARKYCSDGLTGGHVIKLGPGNDDAARLALAAYPGGMQIGGGISTDNAVQWIEAGASHVIVTSWLFDRDGHLLTDRLKALRDCVGRDRLVLDLSCRRCQSRDRGARWRVAMNRWQTLTDLEINRENLEMLAGYASEFLIHAADVEGLCKGIDADLVRVMAACGGLPMTYAGGVATFEDVQLVESASGGKVDVTVGSALDLFGGSGVRYDDLIRWNQRT